MSTLTDVEYVRVGPQISARLNPPKPPPVLPPVLPPVPVVPPVEVSVPAEPVAPAETTEATEATEAAEEEPSVHWWQKKPASAEAEPSAEAGAEPSAEATLESAVAAGIAAGIAASAPATDGTAPGTAKAPREPNPRIRWLLCNGGAAAAGHLVIWSLAGDPMAGAHYVARMTVSVPQLAAAGLTAVAAYGGWRVGALLRALLPGRIGLAVRPLGAVMAAMWGAGTAPLVQTGLTAIEPWGTLLSPLLATGPLAAACWYGLDRPAARARLIRPVRWLARVPLATVVVSSLLYTTSGALL
ncbi:hypothetical protein [Streptomyces sp. NBC_00439]|uniref:hypothetical protein n=1 Tax=Streptomyces sp. NBC_00439 TaxID=2903650 RepID=UPI00225BBE72|nr:hypothetical protein [Streptomyces sp. NBC_00439]MCX5106978.1 hypothetical protein [Streptomyces sp. NBC_00439]